MLTAFRIHKFEFHISEWYLVLHVICILKKKPTEEAKKKPRRRSRSFF